MKLLLQFIFALYRLIPLRIGRLIGYFLGATVSMLGFRRNVIQLQMQRVYRDRNLKDQDECKVLERGFYRHFGLLITETLRLAGGHLDYLDTLFTYEGLEHLDKAVAKGKGVLILGGHIGNWELGGAAMIHKGYPIGTITKVLKGSTGNLLQHLMRDATGLQEFAKKDSIKEIFRALKDNKIIALMVDQNMTVDEGAFIDFMGYSACTITSLGVLAQRSGAAIIPACTYRNPDGLTHHTIIWPEVEIESPHKDRKENVIHNTKRFNETLETMISRQPEQWLWIHKRWKTRPKDEESNPFDYKHWPDSPHQQG